MKFETGNLKLEWPLKWLSVLLISVLCPLISESADRKFDESWDSSLGYSKTLALRWGGGDSVDYTHRARYGTAPVVLTNAGQKVLWMVMGSGVNRTNNYIAATGTVQATAGTVKFFVPPAAANLAPGKYTGFVRTFTAAGWITNAVTLCYQDITVDWTPESAEYATVTPQTNYYSTAEADALFAEIRDQVSGVSGKVDQVETDITDLTGRVTSVEGTLTDLTNRTDRLEQRTNDWNAAYGWGDHAGLYLTLGAWATQSNLIYQAIANATPGGYAAVSNAAMTAYGWGDHATNGYLTAESDPAWHAGTNALWTAIWSNLTAEAFAAYTNAQELINAGKASTQSVAQVAADLATETASRIADFETVSESIDFVAISRYTKDETDAAIENWTQAFVTNPVVQTVDAGDTNNVISGLAVKNALDTKASLSGDVDFNTVKLDNVTPAGAVTFSFDDGNVFDYTVVYPVFTNIGVSGSSALNTALIGTAGKLTTNQIATMKAGGWDFGSHLDTHIDVTTSTVAAVTFAMTNSIATLRGLGINTEWLVWPYGKSERTAQKIASHYFKSARAVRGQHSMKAAANDPLNLQTLESYELRAVQADVWDAPAVASYKALIDSAQAENKWLFFYTHSVNAPEAAALAEVVQYAKDNCQVLSYSAGLALYANPIVHESADGGADGFRAYDRFEFRGGYRSAYAAFSPTNFYFNGPIDIADDRDPIGTQTNAFFNIVPRNGYFKAFRIGDPTSTNGIFMGQPAGNRAFIGFNAGYQTANTYMPTTNTASVIIFQAGKTKFTQDSELNAGTAYSPTTRMTIGTNGYIGIGTESPLSPLSIIVTNAGATSDVLQIRNSATSAGTGAAIKFIDSTDAASSSAAARISNTRAVSGSVLEFGAGTGSSTIPIQMTLTGISGQLLVTNSVKSAFVALDGSAGITTNKTIYTVGPDGTGVITNVITIKGGIVAGWTP